MILFTSNITRIRKTPLEISYDYEIRNKTKIVGFKYGIIPIFKKIKGVFNVFGGFYCLVEDFKEKNFYILNDVIYHKPYCTIWMNDKSSTYVHFKTIEEMDFFVENITSQFPNIIV